MRVFVTVHRQDLRSFKALFKQKNYGRRIKPFIVDSHLFTSDDEIRRMTDPSAEILRLGDWNKLQERYQYRPSLISSLTNMSYPEKLYADAGVAYAVRWSHFRLERDTDLEESVFKLSGASQPYALVIEDISKQVYIDTSDIPNGMQIVRIQETEIVLGGTLVDHALLIQRATIIHAADGALARLAEHLPTSAEMKVLY
jgi:hypothetical protein